MHDVVAYLDYAGCPVKLWEKQLNQFAYDLVFLIKPVKEIYKNDIDRMETFEQALEVHKSIEKIFLESKLKLINIPFINSEKRLDIILKHVNDG